MPVAGAPYAFVMSDPPLHAEASKGSVQPEATLWRRGRAYFVHIFTASGVIFAFLAAVETASEVPDPRWVFVWLLATTVVDALDGPMARAWNVKRFASQIDGRTIDDILDYLTFTFLPLMLVWRLDWLGALDVVLVPAAMLASLLGFANVHAKDEAHGFFLGFPSYWNIYAFYAGLWAMLWGPVVPVVVLVICVALTVLPVRFVYPNLAPRPWYWPLLVGAAIWALLMLAMLPNYHDTPAWLMWVSLIYPAFYFAVSVYLDVQQRRA